MKSFLTSARLNAQPIVAAHPSPTVGTEHDQAPARFAAGAVRGYVQKASFILLALGGSFLASPALAQQPQPVSVQKVNDTTFRLRIQDPVQQAGRVRVVSMVTGQTLLNQPYNAPAYGCDLNFRDLQKGQYRLILQVGQSKYRYIVRVQSQPQSSAALRTLTVKTRLPEMGPASASL